MMMNDDQLSTVSCKLYYSSVLSNNWEHQKLKFGGGIIVNRLTQIDENVSLIPRVFRCFEYKKNEKKCVTTPVRFELTQA